MRDSFNVADKDIKTVVCGRKCASVIKGRLNNILILFHNLHLPKRSSHHYSRIFMTKTSAVAIVWTSDTLVLLFT